MALTKVTGHVIKSDTNITSHNINSSGIVTAVTFDGNFTGVAVTFTGDSTIGSLGITTNLNVGGISTFAGITTVTGDTLFAKQINASGITTLGDRIFAGGTSIPGYSGADDLTIGAETGHHGITIRSGATNNGGLFFSDDTVGGSNANQWAGGIEYNHQGGTLRFYQGSNIRGAFDSSGHLRPWVDSTYDLGTTTYRWRNVVSDHLNLSANATIAGNATISGNLTVDGVLTYQDVTNIDSIGIVTARSDIRGGRNLSVVGIVTANQIKFADSNFGASTNQLRFGSSDDMLIYHDGNNSVIKNQTNDLYIETVGSGDDIIIKSADDLLLQVAGTEDGIKIIGDGAVELYHNSVKKLETTSAGADFSLSSGGQVNLYHLGSDGGLRISGPQSASSATLFFNTNHQNVSGGTDYYTITCGGANHTLMFKRGDMSGTTVLELDDTQHVRIPQDGKALKIGGSQDLQLFHNGSHSYIDNLTGGLYIRPANNFHVQNRDTGEVYLKGIVNGAVELYHDGSERLSTTSTGVDVTGEVATTQDYPNVRPLLDLNFAATKKLDPRITYKRTGPASFTDQDGKVVLVGDNAPRFDHDPDTRESKGLLIEESRTNYLKYSVDFASLSGYDANYSAARSTLASTTELAPDGTNTASKYVRTAGQGTGEVAIIIGNTLGLSSGVVYTSSIFVKNVGNYSTVEMVNTRASDVNDDSQFNLSTGTIQTEGSNNSLTTITPYPNDWYRISVTATHNNLSGYFWVRIYNQPEGDGFMLWGGQVESGGFPSSYIPTHNNASVTRGLDIVTIDKDDIDGIFNPEEGTMFYEAAVTNLTNDNQPIAAFRDVSNTAASYHAMGHAIGGSVGNVRTWAKNAAGSNIHLTAHSGLAAGSFYKHMYGYKYNDYSDAFGQGTNLKQTNTTNSGNHAMNAPGLVDELRFGGYYTSPENNYSLDSGHIKRFSYWPIKLTNTQIKTYVS